ncbi:MAG: hypothetical protein U5L96_05955 [Owenweeksia sp.]|nr:hypothetical protein [Owenweeksia sp.]
MEINGAYYFTGWSSSAGQGQNDYVIMKTDTAGVVQWTEAYGGVENERVFNMHYNSRDSAILLVGYTDYSSTSVSNRNTVLMSADLAGNLNWARSYGSTGTDGHWPAGITTNGDGLAITYLVFLIPLQVEGMMTFT